jgi:pSer/pThr/pTyr-binding forkhead associated (FHA) protein
MTGFVLVRDADGERRVHPVRSPMTIGSRHCDIAVDDPHVGRRHAIIEHFGSGYGVRDLDSKTGTFVNDRQLAAEHQLAAEDVIRIGSVTFTVETVEERSPSPTSDHHGPRGDVPPPDRIPRSLEAKLATHSGPAEFAPALSGGRRRRSAATSNVATITTLSIVAADCVGLILYFGLT